MASLEDACKSARSTLSADMCERLGIIVWRCIHSPTVRVAVFSLMALDDDQVQNLMSAFREGALNKYVQGRSILDPQRPPPDDGPSPVAWLGDCVGGTDSHEADMISSRRTTEESWEEKASSEANGPPGLTSGPLVPEDAAECSTLEQEWQAYAPSVTATEPMDNWHETRGQATSIEGVHMADAIFHRDWNGHAEGSSWTTSHSLFHTNPDLSRLQGAWMDCEDPHKWYVVQRDICKVHGDPLKVGKAALHRLAVTRTHIFWGTQQHYSIKWHNHGDIVEWVSHCGRKNFWWQRKPWPNRDDGSAAGLNACQKPIRGAKGMGAGKGNTNGIELRRSKDWDASGEDCDLESEGAVALLEEIVQWVGEGHISISMLGSRFAPIFNRVVRTTNRKNDGRFKAWLQQSERFNFTPDPVHPNMCMVSVRRNAKRGRGWS